MIVLLGVVELAGRVLYRRGFFVERDAWRWFAKRRALCLVGPREGEVVRLVDPASGQAVVELATELVELPDQAVVSFRDERDVAP